MGIIKLHCVNCKSTFTTNRAHRLHVCKYNSKNILFFKTMNEAKEWFFDKELDKHFSVETSNNDCRYYKCSLKSNCSAFIRIRKTHSCMCQVTTDKKCSLNGINFRVVFSFEHQHEIIPKDFKTSKKKRIKELRNIGVPCKKVAKNHCEFKEDSKEIIGEVSGIYEQSSLQSKELASDRNDLMLYKIDIENNSITTKQQALEFVEQVFATESEDKIKVLIKSLEDVRKKFASGTFSNDQTQTFKIIFI